MDDISYLDLFQYDNIDSIDKLLICATCKKPLKDPVVLECGHMLCHSCIPRVISTNMNHLNFCPECKDTIKNNDTISIFVPKVVYDDLGESLGTCLRCHGPDKIKRSDFKNHIENHCKIQCQLGCSTSLLMNEVDEHNLICENYIVECIANKYFCTWTGPRKDLEQHIKDCSIVKCEPMFKMLNNKIQDLSEDSKRKDILIRYLLDPNIDLDINIPRAIEYKKEIDKNECRFVDLFD